jgi:hypothetical protein
LTPGVATMMNTRGATTPDDVLKGKNFVVLAWVIFKGVK